MTDRYNALTVVLEKNMRSDDAQQLIEAILLLRGVLSVVPNVADLNSAVADRRARSELLEKLIQMLDISGS